MADKRARDQLARAASAFRQPHLPSLVLMTDDTRLPDPIAAARQLPRGSMIIVRSRDDARLVELARELKPIARARSLLLLAALSTKAIDIDGIHLSETRAHEAAHWRARHPNWIITAAAHSLSAAAQARYADAILLSPVFQTRSHSGAATLGPIKARVIARLIDKPVYALGGIDAHTVKRLRCAKLAGIAAIGALDPAAP
jgi:thiamine-phosphate pyrophosphorylase